VATDSRRGELSDEWFNIYKGGEGSLSCFRSKLEEMMPAEELLFDPTPGFGKYKRFLEHAVTHPAKANTKLLEFLIKRFTKKGDVVLDPMAGTGSTGVVAALHGRNAICVELEEKFYKWMEKARENVEKHPTLTPKGKIVNICGDARKLSELLSQADVCITSPPYANIEPTQFASGSLSKKKGDFKKEREKLVKMEGYSDNPENIGNLPHGDIDAIITSPPYKTEMRGSGLNKDDKGLGLGCKWNGYSDNKENIDNVPYGEIDAVIISPPYERQLHDSREKRAAGAWRGSKLDVEKNLPMGYSENKNNIGNLKKETYLEAMLKVYSEMWKVLKPGGLAIIIVKPFIRNKKVVDLPYHTWLLLQKIGFKLAGLYKLRLKTRSFWRILYERKFPEVPTIRHEYVIIAKKRLSQFPARLDKLF